MRAKTAVNQTAHILAIFGNLRKVDNQFSLSPIGGSGQIIGKHLNNQKCENLNFVPTCWFWSEINSQWRSALIIKYSILATTRFTFLINPGPFAYPNSGKSQPDLSWRYSHQSLLLSQGSIKYPVWVSWGVLVIWGFESSWALTVLGGKNSAGRHHWAVSFYRLHVRAVRGKILRN